MKEDIIEELSEQKRKVDFNTYDISVKELISMVSESLINIAPEYQRQFRWDDTRQSLLIESIFLGIPVPPLFMATNSDGTWEVIDGVQRLSTIINFVADKDSKARETIQKKDLLKLKDLNKLKSCNGVTFNDLPRLVKLDFLLKPIKITTLSDKSDKSVRFDLFERLNTGGIKLSEQEIRSCIFRGNFNNFIKKKSQYENFKNTVKLPKSDEQDGSREELVLRFFAYLNDKEAFEHSVIDFLNNYMENSSEKFNYAENESIFNTVFAKLNQLEHGIVKSATRSITSYILFEAVAVGAAEALKEKDDICIDGFYEWVKDKDFNKLITGATNTRSRVLERIEFCKNKFLGE